MKGKPLAIVIGMIVTNGRNDPTFRERGGRAMHQLRRSFSLSDEPRQSKVWWNGAAAMNGRVSRSKSLPTSEDGLPALASPFSGNQARASQFFRYLLARSACTRGAREAK